MIFSESAFLIYFLPTLLAVFYSFNFIKRFNTNYRYHVLILSSLFFYSWWYPPYIFILLASIVFNFLAAKHISNVKTSTSVFIVVFINLLLLGVFKYLDFFISNINFLLNKDYETWNIVLPLAISFFTFQQIAYVVDVKRGICKEYSLKKYTLFIVFFPQLIAGPIVHHSQIVYQFDEAIKHGASRSQFKEGIILFFLGLGKKVLIADSLSFHANSVFNAAGSGVNINFIESWLGVLAYTFQIYFDFSGYSDMAVGLALMFGLKIPFNFNSPYKSLNIIDFWRRWHITLSNFLRDYLYISLGGNRYGMIKRYRNLFLTMLIGGLWHGASWNFVFWGGLHGIYLILNHGWRNIIKDCKNIDNNIFYIIFSWLVTFLAVTFAWIFFRAESFDTSVLIINAMFSAEGIILPQIFSNFEFFSYLASKNIISFQSYENFGSAVGMIYIFIAFILIWPINSIKLSKVMVDSKRPLYFIFLSIVIYLALTKSIFFSANEFIYFNF